MKATVRIKSQDGYEFEAEFPHDVCIEEEIVCNGHRMVIIDIYLENLPTTAETPNKVKFQHVVVIESAETGE